MVWYTRTCSNLAVNVRVFFSIEVVAEYYLLTLDKIKLLGNLLPRDDKLTLNHSPNELCIGVKMLTQRHKVLGCLNNAFSISAKNVFSFFMGNFTLCSCLIYQKAMCYVSSEFLALKLRQGSSLIAHKGTMFFLLKDTGKPCSIPGDNWSI